MKFPSGRSALRIPHGSCPNSSPSPAQHQMQPSPLNVVGEGPVPSRGPETCLLNSACVHPGHGRAQGTSPTHTRRGSLLRRVGIPVLTALMMLALLAGMRPDSASAHPLGNFTVNQYARIEVTADGPRVVYVLDMAEVPAFQEIKAIDASGDGEIDDGERAAYLDRMVGTIGRALELTVDGQTPHPAGRRRKHRLSGRAGRSPTDPAAGGLCAGGNVAPYRRRPDGHLRQYVPDRPARLARDHRHPR